MKIEYCDCPECGGTNLGRIERVPVSNTPTPWAVVCREHGKVFLTNHEYNRQMNRPNSLWQCPMCLDSAAWDDDTYEAWLDEMEKENPE